MASNSVLMSETETSLDSFDAMPTWSTNMINASSSFQSDVTVPDDNNFGMTQPHAAVNGASGLQGLGTEFVDTIGMWTDGTADCRRDHFGPYPAWFTQDFTLYENQDALQQVPVQNTSCAAEEAAILLAPSITLTPPSSFASANSSPNKKAKHGHALPRLQSRKRASRPAIPCSVTGCQKTFTRASDLDRHVRNVHGQSSEHYSCVIHRCLYRTRRKDKMQEHCQKVHAYARGAEAFDTIAEEAGPSTPLSSSEPASTPGSSYAQ